MKSIPTKQRRDAHKTHDYRPNDSSPTGTRLYLLHQPQLRLTHRPKSNLRLHHATTPLTSPSPPFAQDELRQTIPPWIPESLLLSRSSSALSSSLVLSAESLSLTLRTPSSSQARTSLSNVLTAHSSPPTARHIPRPPPSPIPRNPSHPSTLPFRSSEAAEVRSGGVVLGRSPTPSAESSLLNIPPTRLSSAMP